MGDYNNNNIINIIKQNSITTITLKIEIILDFHFWLMIIKKMIITMKTKQKKMRVRMIYLLRN